MSGALHPERLDANHREQVTATLLSCCASAAWVRELLARGPFRTADDALDGSDAALAAVSPADIDEALAGHPRIGDRVTGTGADADFSRREQAGVADADAAVTDALREGNIAYEQRFDRVFLIRAAGRSPQEMLAELRRRLAHDDETEADEVREQLRQITRLRLADRLAGHA